MDKEVLGSQDHRNLLDIIDRLRSKGISRFVDLPQIVVCGDQSAGKSSVLEAISGISFPTKDNLCTRFATELVLRRDSQAGVKVSIHPSPDRTREEAERLSAVRFDAVSTQSELGDLIEKVKDAMGLSDSKVFSTDVLRVEIYGTTQPHLTLVDLPGLFRAGNSEQSTSDSKIVKRLVRGYMKSPRSIILAVVSAKSDFALQEVTEFAREIDPQGERTMGLITKPDTLDTGSDSERSYIRLAENKDVRFRLGWHVLKNRSYETRSASSTERDQYEQAFFSSGNWAVVDPTCLGVTSLKPRLSSVLRNQILRQLPSLLEDVRAGISDCHTRLERIGQPRNTREEKRRFLSQISQDFTALMRSAVGGVYTDRFFGSARTDEGFNRRLRAVVQDTLDQFKDHMSAHGQTRIIIDRPSEAGPLKQEEVSRSDYLMEVVDLTRRSRGCELLGTFNPMIIGELFADQCRPWEGIAIRTKDTIVHAIVQTTKAILKHITTEDTADALYRLIGSRIDVWKKSSDSKLAELMKPHKEGHPITYNHYLTDNVQKAQLKRQVERFDKILKDIGVSESSEPRRNFDARVLRTSYAKSIEVDMKSYASEWAVDYVQSYYKVALKTFIDDFSVLAIEQCLMENLPSLLDTQAIYELSEEQIVDITAESKEMIAERVQCIEKQTTLGFGLQELEYLARHSSGNIAFFKQDGSDSVPNVGTSTRSSPSAATIEIEPLRGTIRGPDQDLPPIQPDNPTLEDEQMGIEFSQASTRYAPQWKSKKVKR